MATETLTIRINADNRAGRALRSLQGDVRTLGRIAVRTGAAFTGVMAAGAAVSVREFIKFEDALTGVAKTVDAPQRRLEALADEFRAMSEEIPVATNEMLRVAELGGQLGVGVDALDEFAETIAALDVATDLGTEEASLSLARFSEVMGLAESDIERVGSAIVELGNNFATTESEIVDTQQFFAATARAAGFTAGEVLGLATAIRSAGIRSQAGGSAIMVTIQEIDKAVTGTTDTLDTFADVAGVSAERFAETFREDAAEALTMFVEGLSATVQRGESLTSTLDALGLADRRVTRGLTGLASAQGLVRDATETGNRAFEENVALAQEASRFYDRLGADLATLRNAFVNNFSEIAEDAAPQLREAIDQVKGAIPGLARVFADTLAEMLDMAAGFIQELEVLVDQLSGTPVGKLMGLDEQTDRTRLIGLGEQEDAVLRAIRGLEEFEERGLTGQVPFFSEARRAGALSPRGAFNLLSTAGVPVEELRKAGGGQLTTQVLQDFADELRAEITELTRQGAQDGVVQGLVDGLRTAASGLRSSEFGFTRSGDDAVSGGAQRALSPIVDRMLQERILGGVGLGSGGAGGGAAGRGGGGLSRVGLGTRQLMDAFRSQEALRFIESLGEDAGDRFSASLGDQLKQGGRFAMESLLSGLFRGADNIGDQLKNLGIRLASALLTQGLFSGLGIASPSTRAEFAGRMVGEGLARGIESKVDRVKRAMGRLTSPITGAEIGAPTMRGVGALASGGGMPIVQPIDPRQLPPMSQMAARLFAKDQDVQMIWTVANRAERRRR